MHTLTVSAKGHVVIPADVRARLGIAPGSKLTLHVDHGDIRLSVERFAARASLDDGYGLLRYDGPPRDLLAFDTAEAMRAER